MKIAIYARTSRTDQVLDNQLLPLERYAQVQGWEYEVFTEQESTRKTRPIQYGLYQRLLKKEFDGVLIYKFDRWARSLNELVQHMKDFTDRNIRFISYQENVDLGTSTGRLMFAIIGAMAEFERDIIRERTLAGLERAKLQGKIKGRHPKECGCGAVDKYGNKHEGLIKPIRDEQNCVVGWKYEDDLSEV